MDALEGIWRPLDSQGQDEAGNSLASPQGQAPIGGNARGNGRMLAVVCNGETLRCAVDAASDRSHLGGTRTRAAAGWN